MLPAAMAVGTEVGLPAATLAWMAPVVAAPLAGAFDRLEPTHADTATRTLIKRKRRLDYMNRLPIRDLDFEGWTAPPSAKLEAAAQIDTQKERWSCGPNAAARALAVFGVQVNFPRFVERCPRHFNWPLLGGAIETGPLPGELCGYTNEHLPQHYSVRLVETQSRDVACQALRQSLRRGAPVVCMLTFDDFEVHYVAAVAWRDGRVAFFNSNGNIYWMSEDDFLQQLDSRDSILHRLGKVRPYNMICFGNRNHDDFLGSKALTAHEGFYRAVRDELREIKSSPVEHYWRSGVQEQHVAAPWFDVKYYMLNNPDVSQNSVEAAQHYQLYGVHEGRVASPYFDPRYYLRTNPDVAAAFGRRNYAAAVAHWCGYGISENRPGSPMMADTMRMEPGNLFHSMIGLQRSRQ